jgi:protocatechuate 3,4-dioxygenase beta subunit
MAISRLCRFIAFAMSITAMAMVAAQQPPRDPPPRRDPSVPRTGTGSIFGQVVLSSGEPVSDAEVSISSVRGRTTTSTGADGRFEFSALPAGAYHLYANRRDLLSVRYGERIYNHGGQTIPLADGEHREFRLTLPRRSKIVGMVTDTSGRPLAKASVRALRLMPVALYGYPAVREMASATTDASGAYAFERLDPADYAICASTKDTLPLGRAVGYAVACTPATADSPQKITIAPEETRLGVNITLVTARFRRVEGVLNVPRDVSNPSRILLEFLNVDEMYIDPSLTVSMAAEGGAFRFPHVAPGRYVLRAFTGPVEDRAGVMREVTVEDADITDLVLTMVRGSTVAGHLEFHGTVLPSAGAHQPRLMLCPPVPGQRSQQWGCPTVTPDAAGAFVFPSVQPGLYRLSADYLQPQNWYMASVAVPDRPDHLIDVRAGQNVADVVLEMTDYRAEVTGSVVTAPGVPAFEFMVVVYPANPKEWDALAASGRVGLDGSFDFKIRRPGTYRIGLVPDYDPAVRIGPDVLRDVDRTAVTVSLADGQKKTVRLVIPAGR